MKVHSLAKLLGLLVMFDQAACSEVRKLNILGKPIEEQQEYFMTSLGQVIDSASNNPPSTLSREYYTWFSAFCGSVRSSAHKEKKALRKERLILPSDSDWKYLIDAIIRGNSSFLRRRLLIKSWNSSLHESTIDFMAMNMSFEGIESLEGAISQVQVGSMPGYNVLNSHISRQNWSDNLLAIHGELKFGQASKPGMGDEFAEQVANSFSESVLENLHLPTVIRNLRGFSNWASGTLHQDLIPKMSHLTLVKDASNFCFFENSDIIKSDDCRGAFFSLVVDEFIPGGSLSRPRLSEAELIRLVNNGVENDICSLAVLAVGTESDSPLRSTFIMKVRFPKLARINEGWYSHEYWRQVYATLGFDKEVQEAFIEMSLHQWFSKSLIKVLKKSEVAEEELSRLMAKVVFKAPPTKISNELQKDFTQKFDKLSGLEGYRKLYHLHLEDSNDSSSSSSSSSSD